MEFLDLAEISLLRMSLIRTASDLWLNRKSDIFDGGLIDYFEHRQAEARVASRVKLMSLPESVKNQLSFIVMPIGREIHIWCRKMSTIGVFRPSVMRRHLPTLPWNADGTIDEELAAQRLLQDLELSIREKYLVACEFYLESEIGSLWPLVRHTSFYEELRDNNRSNFRKCHLEGEAYEPYEKYDYSI